MRYTVCDARDLRPGHLGLIGHPSGRNLPVFPVRSEQNLFLLMLPTKIPEPRLDFRLRRIVSQSQKVLDLGADFAFDFDLNELIMRDEKITDAAGSLLITSTGLALTGVLGQDQSTYDGEVCRVSVGTGEFGITRQDHTCEVRSWRLLLPHPLPTEPAKLIASWPLPPATTTNTSALRL